MKTPSIEESIETTVKVMSPLWLIPNVIGYIRILFLIVAACFALQEPLLTTIAFFVSANLDAFDGYFARKFNQESRFGTMLDYATDRISEVILFFIIAMLYPSWWSVFCLILVIDIFSHICQLYSTVFSKLNNHKLVGKKQGIWLKVYYSDRQILYWACASYDLWLACLYLAHFYVPKFFIAISFLFLMGFVFKVIIHFLQIISVFRMVSED